MSTVPGPGSPPEAPARPRIERKDRGKSHSYYLDGVKVPGVTTVLNVLAKEALPYWAAKVSADYAMANLDNLQARHPDDARQDIIRAHQHARDAAAARGTRAHELVVPLAKGERLSPDDGVEMVKLLDAAKAFLDEWKFFPLVQEAVCWSEVHRYAGTLDMVGVSRLHPGRVFLADWKTNSSNVYPETGLQLAAYAGTDYYEGPQGEQLATDALGITDHIVVWLHDDGTYTVRPTSTGPEAMELFLALLGVYRAKAQVFPRLLLDELTAPQGVAQ